MEQYYAPKEAIHDRRIGSGSRMYIGLAPVEVFKIWDRWVHTKMILNVFFSTIFKESFEFIHKNIKNIIRYALLT
jgi:hypothetical protein